jgi:16S rRNA (guanine527-N7)-methyltransferase
MNLISRKDTGRLVSYHFADSLSLLPVIAPERHIRILDIGGSNGLPGLVLSGVLPEADLLICDGRTKRAVFLEEACGNAGPGHAFTIGRVDDRDFVAGHVESFDLIVARAVTGLKLLLKWCLPLLRPGGMLAAYKGSRCNSEVALARKYFFTHGGALLAVVGSPLKNRCNPLRKFAIAVKSN